MAVSELRFAELFSENLHVLIGAMVLSIVLYWVLSNGASPATGPLALDKHNFVKLPLVEKIQLSPDTFLFRFGLQSEEHVLGLPVGQHISFKYEDEEGKLVMRPYTPVSSDDDKGHVDFIIKVYRAGEHPKFPDGGKMSQYVAALEIGDTMEMRGPKGHVEYKGRGTFEVTERRVTHTRRAKNVGMIAGGTGITPMLQIAAHMFKKSDDKTEVSLLYANKSEDDILVRDRLTALEEKHPDRFNLWYTLDSAPENWEYSEGFINADMISKHLPPPGPDTLILVCGPPPMVKFACQPAFEELGYTEEMIIVM